MDKVKVYQHEDGTYDWHRKSENGQIVSTSGNQGYEDRLVAIRMAEALNGGEWEFDEESE